MTTAEATIPSPATWGRPVNPAGRLFYVCQEFPVLTQTFTAGEVAGLAEEGLDPQLVSCRRPSRAPAAPRALYLPPPFAPAALGAFGRAARGRSRALARCLAVAAGARYRDEAGRCWLRGFAQVLWGALLAERAAGRPRPHFHAQFVDSASTVAYVAATLSGGSFSFTNHTAYNPYALAPKLREAAVVLSISKFDRAMLLAMGRGAGAEKIRVAYQGIDTAFFDVPRVPSPPKIPARILSVGALREKKGHHVLLGALARLRQEGIPFLATVVGEGPERARLEARRGRLELEREVEFAGAEEPEAIRQRLAEADVFVLCVRQCEKRGRRRDPRVAHGGHGRPRAGRVHADLRHPRARGRRHGRPPRAARGRPRPRAGDPARPRRPGGRALSRGEREGEGAPAARAPGLRATCGGGP